MPDLSESELEPVHGEDSGYVPRRAALSATSYPVWVSVFGLLVLAAFGYSSISLPHNIALAKILSRANSLDAAQNYVGAEQAYTSLLRDMPTSEAGRLGMAHALFADADVSNDPAALALLEGIQLQGEEWDRIASVMPAEYQRLFVREKR